MTEQRVDLADPSLYVNREISALRFFGRVLEEAEEPDLPLLERVKFLSILGSIQAEFFMVRVAGLKPRAAAGVDEPSPDGMTPQEQLAAIRPLALELMVRSQQCFRRLVADLDRAGVQVADYAALDDRQRARAREYFENIVFPVLTPLAHDPGRPFPFISNMSLNLAVMMRDEEGRERFARVKVPSTLPRLVRVSEGAEAYVAAPPRQTLVWLEQVVAANLGELFPGMEIVESHQFRVTRDADIVIQELDAEDLLETIERSVRRRRFGSVVRMVIDRAMPDRMRDLLANHLGVGPDDIYSVDLPLAMTSLGMLYDVDRPDLKDPAFVPAEPRGLQGVEGAEIFDVIKRGDILLHHPYESFGPVLEFLETAARDPDVLAIKITLYRVGKNAPVIDALREAALNGKQVAVLVELKARFDEENNIEWARALEREGVHVVYGVRGLKTHAKLAMVVRREGDRVRRYVHLSSGNYNAVTARQYTDIGLFTADEDFGIDASHFFNNLTGHSNKRDYRRLLVAPFNLRTDMERLIEREIEHQRAGRCGRLIFKINALVDRRMIELLYRASQAGVRCDLLVRGICCLRPGVPGVSETIEVTSIVGRFLEHSRAYWFANGGRQECYLGSADLMPRNLNRRFETLFPVQDPRLIQRLRYEILETFLADNVNARRMLPDGDYVRVTRLPGEGRVDSQGDFIPR